jgi:hypothetical protein
MERRRRELQQNRSEGLPMKWCILIEPLSDECKLLGPYKTQAEAEAVFSRLEIAGLSRNEIRSARILEQEQTQDGEVLSGSLDVP